MYNAFVRDWVRVRVGIRLDKNKNLFCYLFTFMTGPTPSLKLHEKSMQLYYVLECRNTSLSFASHVLRLKSTFRSGILRYEYDYRPGD